MAYYARQQDELNPLSEISFVVLNPGAVGNGTTVSVAVAATLDQASGSIPATTLIGDILEIYPSVNSGVNGLSVTAFPTATQGTIQVYFTNNTGASITPLANAVYKVIATRLLNDLVS